MFIPAKRFPAVAAVTAAVVSPAAVV